MLLLALLLLLPVIWDTRGGTTTTTRSGAGAEGLTSRSWLRKILHQACQYDNDYLD
jgi:hypothetical protein